MRFLATEPFLKITVMPPLPSIDPQDKGGENNDRAQSSKREILVGVGD